MDEINPYTPPGSSLRVEVPSAAGRPIGYGCYKWCSLVYGGLIVALGLTFMYRQIIALSVIGMVVVLVILAPVISYLLVAARASRLFYAWLSLHLLGLLMLVAFGVERVDSADGFKAGISLFMIGSSLLSWLTSLYFHWRLGNK